MSENNYFRLQLKNVRPDQEELIGLWCFDHEAGGVAEDLPFVQNPEDYSVTHLARDQITLNAFFTRPLSQDDLDEFKARFPNVDAEVHAEAARDWLAEWKKGFEPFHLVAGVWVVPNWCQVPAEAKQVIWLEPGMAFGTGTHATTRVAAELLAEALKSRPGARVLDVGTGTGILAILAKLLGAQEVVGTDIDPEAVRVARENCLANGLPEIAVSDQDLSEFSRRFDVVVANIIDGVLVVLQSQLKRLTGPGGALVLSGIIDERLNGFRERFTISPEWSKTEMRQDEWSGWLLERR